MNHLHRARVHARRRGATLIELVLVIGGVTAVLLLCAGLLHALLSLDRSGRGALNDTATVARLARRFRQDARAATAAKPSPKEGSPGLEFTKGDGPAIAYRVEGKRLFREEVSGKTVKSREGYAVDRLGPVGFVVEGGRVRLVLSRKPSGPHVPARPAVRVEATLGKDLALADRKGVKK